MTASVIIIYIYYMDTVYIESSNFFAFFPVESAEQHGFLPPKDGQKKASGPHSRFPRLPSISTTAVNGYAYLYY